MHGVRQAHAARGHAETHLLLHTPTVPLTPQPSCSAPGWRVAHRHADPLVHEITAEQLASIAAADARSAWAPAPAV
jgi:hypothetical protein